MLKKAETPILLVIALGCMANAVWMLTSPNSWFTRIPAAMPDYGPFNPHLVRDAGAAYMIAAIALIYAAMRRSQRHIYCGMAATFFGLHAGIHLFDTATAHVDSLHWFLDLPTTYLPFIALAWITYSASRDRG